MILSSLKSKSVGFLTGLIIILLAAIAAGYWAWMESLREDVSIIQNSSPSPLFDKEGKGEFEGWKTYRNEEYGFEVKYPPADVSEVVENGPDSYELQLREGRQISGTQAPLLESVYFKNKFGEIILAVDIPDNRNLGIVTGDYGWWLRPCGQEGFAEIKSKENLVFAGQKTLRVVSIFEFENPSKEQTYFYCINHPRNPIIISYQKTTFGYLIEPILSTFRFIEQVDTSNWQTYRNEEYGFEVKYPQNWTVSLGEPPNTASPSFGPASNFRPLFIIKLVKSSELQKEKELLFTDTEFIEHNEIDIDGVPADDYLYLSANVQNPLSKAVLFERDRFGYVIYGQEGTEQEESLKIFNQILSTFKFIE